MKENEDKLLGDEVEALIKKIGADKLAEAYEEATNKDCGCEKRKEWLNNIHRKWKEGRLHFYDKQGWEVEGVPGQWFRNFFRKIIYTRKIEWK